MFSNNFFAKAIEKKNTMVYITLEYQKSKIIKYLFDLVSSLSYAFQHEANIFGLFECLFEEGINFNFGQRKLMRLIFA